MHFLEDFILHHQLLLGLNSIAAMLYNELEGDFSFHPHIFGLTTTTLQPCSRMHRLDVLIPHMQLMVGHKNIAAAQHHELEGWFRLTHKHHWFGRGYIAAVHLN